MIVSLAEERDLAMSVDADGVGAILEVFDVSILSFWCLSLWIGVDLFFFGGRHST